MTVGLATHAETTSVLVVGAGSAGLATAAALRRRNIPVTVLERGEGVGQSWRQRPAGLRLNTLRRMSELPGLHMSRRLGRWVSREDYLAYLGAFAAHHRLDVRFGVEVARVDRSAQASWLLRTSAGNLYGSHVVVATGLERVSKVPDWPGRDGFRVPVVHTADQRSVAGLARRRVLLVGAGNSGIDTAERLVDAGVGQLWLSVRTPPNLLPLTVAGVPLQPVALALGRLPESWRDAIARWLARRAFGDLAPWGLPTPPRGPYERLRTTGVTGAVDRGFVAHLRAGRVRVVPEVERLEGATVVLRDHSTLRPDIVIAATGYDPGLRSLVGHLGVLDSRGLPLSADSVAGLWFAGYRPSLDGNLARHPAEAERIAQAISRERNRRCRWGYQVPRWTTSSKGRRFGWAIGRSGRSDGYPTPSR